MGHLTGRSQWCGQESWKTGLGTFEMGKQNVMCFKMRIYIKEQFHFLQLKHILRNGNL